MSSDSTIVVRRKEVLGRRERPFLSGAVRALWVVARHVLAGRSFRSEPHPGAAPAGFAEARSAHVGMPVLVSRSDGSPRCVACGLCARACPSHCIEVVPSELATRADDAPPAHFDLDLSRCLFCGLCEDACPVEAVVMSSHVEVAGFDRASMVFHLSDLLVPPDYVAERLARIRAESPGAAPVDGSFE